MTTLRSPFSTRFTDSAAADLAATLRLLADPSRLKILALLDANGAMTVSGLTACLPVSQPTVSHHLRLLAGAGLITRRETGRFTRCELDGPALRTVARLLAPGGGL